MRYFGNVIHLAVEDVLANWRVCTSLSILSHHLPVNKKRLHFVFPKKNLPKLLLFMSAKFMINSNMYSVF
jgi:hypothetical protein